MGQGAEPPELRSNRAYVLSRQGRHAEALELLRPLVAECPDFMPAWSNLAVALHGLGDVQGAAQAEARVHALQPDSPQAQVAAGLVALQQGWAGAALNHFRQAVQRAPAMPEAWINLGLALLDMGEAHDAVQAFEQALSLAPDDERAWSNLMMALQYDTAHASEGLKQAAQRAGSALAARAQAWGLKTPDLSTRQPGRCRIAYLSGDLRRHPVGWMMAPVLAAHDRQRFEVHVLDTSPPAQEPDDLTRRLRSMCDAWHAVGSMDDAALAGFIQHLGMDVLVDLAGHTQRGRPVLMSQRVAHRQWSYLGWFAGTGLAEVDGWLLGGQVWSEFAAAFAPERVIRLSRLHMAYEPPAYAPAPAPMPPCVSNGHVTFGCFNNTAKLNDDVVACWAQVLHAVPGSRLLLKWKTLAEPWFVQHVQHRFGVCGISADRLVLRPASDHAEMLSQYNEVDVALDPFPFCGGLTTLEALWMGVPVVTLPQARPVSRQTLGCLEVLGMADLAAATVGEYVQTAVALANDVDRLTALRQNLRDRMRDSDLCDGASLARALEEVYAESIASH